MSIEFFWQLPTSGDGRSLRKEHWNRGDYTPPVTSRPVFARTDVRRGGYTWYDHLAQIARAAEITGFDGVSIPQTPAGEEPWVVSGALAREARRLKFLPSLPAPFLSAVYSAKMAISFQRLTGGRLAWNLITEEHTPKSWHGHRWSIAEQIARTGEFLDVVKGFWSNAPFTYQGRYYEVENGGFGPALAGPELPLIYLSGETEEALALSARYADVHFLPLDSLEATRGRIADLTRRAAAHGRALRFAIQADVVARHSGEDAWQDLRGRWDREIAKTVPISGAIDHSQGADKEGFDELILGSNLWTGFGLVRPGAPAGIVGSYREVADLIKQYIDAGVGTFALSANPHLEEAYRIGEQLLPLLRARPAQPLEQLS
ncbi:LLM class flavin-dependent oxidoreductase [Candidatus Methylospira mobilis]|nr:LLM class flavin-dependent oxidoreductase [Candidatus Methylospira mobilis]